MCLKVFTGDHMPAESGVRMGRFGVSVSGSQFVGAHGVVLYWFLHHTKIRIGN
jgi:hypothetical protein